MKKQTIIGVAVVMIIGFVMTTSMKSNLRQSPKTEQKSIVVKKKIEHSNYGFFVRDNSNFGWGQEIPPF